VLLITFLTLIPFHLQHTYTLVTMSFSAAMIAWALLTKSARHWLSGFLLSYAISLIPFFLVNGVLTSLPVVWYNDAQNMGIRLWTIPLEDAIYLLGLLLPIHLIYHALLERRASPRLRKDMGLDVPSGF
jgi:lycopene cyclase domain-containing protein